MKKIKTQLASIEKAPLVRKFTVLFIVMSLLPFLIIAYFFVSFHLWHEDVMGKNVLFTLIFLTGAGALVGFYAMRKSIMKIQEISTRAADTLAKDIPGLGKMDTEESEVTRLARIFTEVTQNLEYNIKRLERSKKTMQYVLSKLVMGISSLQSIDTFLEVIVEITTNALDAKTGILMLLDENKQELYVKAASGLEEDLRSVRLKLDEDAPGWVAKNKKPLVIPQIHKADLPRNELFTPPLLCVPMLYQSKIIGVLLVAGRLNDASFGDDELLIISNLASQTAVAVENERLHMDAEETYLETISALAMAVEARDPYSRGHLDRVSRYAVKVAQNLGLSPELIKDIKNAATLHDVGKIGISDDILKNTDHLNQSEIEIIRKHTLIGESIIKPVRSLTRLCDMIRHHHEWVDGSGYPDRLKGEQINIGAKILAVTDAFDAITTDRPYHKALNFEAAKEELRKNIGTHFDREVTEAFLGSV